MAGVADVFGGAAEGILFNSLYDGLKELISKSLLFRPLRDEILSLLDSCRLLIKQIEASNEEIGYPKEDAEQFKAHMEEGMMIVIKCSEVRIWNFYKKYKYTYKLLKWHDHLQRLVDVLIKQVERIQRNERANLDSIKKIESRRIPICAPAVQKNEIRRIRYLRNCTAGPHTDVEMRRHIEIAALSGVENASKDTRELIRELIDQVKTSSRIVEARLKRIEDRNHRIFYCSCVFLFMFILSFLIIVIAAGSSPGTKFFVFNVGVNTLLNT